MRGARGGVAEEAEGGAAAGVEGTEAPFGPVTKARMEVEEQDYADTGGSGVMVSNLPLLFSRGSPSSLYEMNQVRGSEGTEGGRGRRSRKVEGEGGRGRRGKMEDEGEG